MIIFRFSLFVLLLASCMACSVESIHLSKTTIPISTVVTATPSPLTPSVGVTPDLIADFPLALGNTWVYSSTRYEGYEGPNRMTATYVITEKVVETQIDPPYFVAKVQREERLVAAPAQWNGSEEWTELYWRILSGTQLYQQRFELDLSDPASFQLEYVFPLSEKESWCPGEKIQEKDCTASGKRTVLKATSRNVPAGEFESCFEIGEDFNTGVYSHWFCPGIGIIEAKGDHSGFPFGRWEKLIDFELKPP
jgi:hypothetical protein